MSSIGLQILAVFIWNSLLLSSLQLKLNLIISLNQTSSFSMWRYVSTCRYVGFSMSRYECVYRLFNVEIQLYIGISIW